MAQIAVLATQVDDVETRVGQCPDVNPICPLCVVQPASAACVRGVCQIRAANVDVADDAQQR
jgi:hypothetical protein